MNTTKFVNIESLCLIFRENMGWTNLILVFLYISNIRNFYIFAYNAEYFCDVSFAYIFKKK